MMENGIEKEIEFTEYLKDYCEKKHITAYELSKTTGVSMTYCYKLVSGNMKNPSLRIIRQIGVAMNLKYEKYLSNVNIY